MNLSLSYHSLGGASADLEVNHWVGYTFWKGKRDVDGGLLWVGAGTEDLPVKGLMTLPLGQAPGPGVRRTAG